MYPSPISTSRSRASSSFPHSVIQSLVTPICIRLYVTDDCLFPEFRSGLQTTSQRPPARATGAGSGFLRLCCAAPAPAADSLTNMKMLMARTVGLLVDVAIAARTNTRQALCESRQHVQLQRHLHLHSRSSLSLTQPAPFTPCRRLSAAVVT